jgi:nitroreductase
MDIFEVMKSRRSIRVFTKRTPSRKIIEQCLEAATWAPNPSNQQPWEFIVITGERLKKISQIIARDFPQRMKEIDPYRGIPESCEKQKNETFGKIFSAAQKAGIDPKDLFQKNLSFHEAPVAVLFITYKMENPYYRYATAAVLQNFLLAAHAKGLGTCWLSTVSACEEEIKAHLKIPEEMEIVDGVALGYPAKNSPLNTYPRTRLPMKKVSRWIGF